MSLFPQTPDELAKELFEDARRAKNSLGSSEKYDNGYADAMDAAARKVQTLGETLEAQKRNTSLVLPVFRLENDDYSQPRGSLCLITEELRSGDLAVRWLPPRHGGSVPIAREDLEEAGELSIPSEMIP